MNDTLLSDYEQLVLNNIESLNIFNLLLTKDFSDDFILEVFSKIEDNKKSTFVDYVVTYQTTVSQETINKLLIAEELDR